MIKTMFAAAAVAVALPFAAGAQVVLGYTPPIPRGPMTDQQYCESLSELYLRYVGGNEGSDSTLSRRSDIEGRYAVSRCQKGDAVAAIPILERKLRNNGFTLPERG
jgi:hypothetical protein